MKRNQDPINRFIWERRKREKDMKEEVNRKENPTREMNLMQLPHEQGKNQDIEVDVVLPLFSSLFLTVPRFHVVYKLILLSQPLGSLLTTRLSTSLLVYFISLDER